MAIRDLTEGTPRAASSSVSPDGSVSAPRRSLPVEVTRLLDTILPGFRFPELMARISWPSVEVIESDDAIRLKAEIPGVSQDEITITLEDDVLSLRGEKKSDDEEADRRNSELYYGRFDRRFNLPPGLDAAKASANLTNGVLTITLPRVYNSNPARKIPVSTGP